MEDPIRNSVRGINPNSKLWNKIVDRMSNEQCFRFWLTIREPVPRKGSPEFDHVVPGRNSDYEQLTLF